MTLWRCYLGGALGVKGGVVCVCVACDGVPEEEGGAVGGEEEVPDGVDKPVFVSFI